MDGSDSTTVVVDAFFHAAMARQGLAGGDGARRLQRTWVVLIFLSATLAGFFVLRRLKAGAEEEAGAVEGCCPKEPLPLTEKVRSAICLGFWTCVDMASGRYLWRHLAGGTPAGSGKKL